MLLFRVNDQTFIIYIFFKWFSFNMVLDKARISLSQTFFLLFRFCSFTQKLLSHQSLSSPLLTKSGRGIFDLPITTISKSDST